MRPLVAAVALLLLAAPAARADTIVFRRGGDIWRMAPDGSGQVPLTGGEHAYEWPSMADDGTLVASDERGRLHRFTRDGVALGAPIPTAATTSVNGDPAESPTHVRISPDAARIAYDEVIDGDPTTLWTPAAATALELPGQALGQAFLVAPSWIGTGTLLLSRDIASPDVGATFMLYMVGAGDNSAAPWFSDRSATWATGFDAAASRDGRRVAVLEDDAADHDGVPARVVLRIFSGAVFGCEFALTAAGTYAFASPTFSPDGSRLAWAESDGIHVADADCGAEHVITGAGAWEPYWSPASDPPPNRSGTPPPPAKLTLALATHPRPHRLTLRKRGLRIRVTVSAPTTITLTLRGRGVDRTLTRKLAGPTTLRLTLPAVTVKRARRLTVRVTAPGAAPATATIRPRT